MAESTHPDATTVRVAAAAPDTGAALVTGASGALGDAIVRRLANDGWAVAVHHRTQRPDALLADLDSAGARFTSVSGDLSDEAQAHACVDAAVAALGPVHLVVANAADQSVSPLADLTSAQWSAMIDATLLSAVNVISRAVTTMPSGGAIVTVASVEAFSAFPSHAHYAAAKAAMLSYTRSLALDLGPRGIRANAVAPGLIWRDGLDQSWPQGLAWWQASAPSGRPVTADEVAQAVAFLGSSAASGISGAVLPVDGGWSASARAPF